MKVLIVGQHKKWAIENHYLRYMSKQIEVETYPAEDIFDEFYHKSIFNKIKFKLGLSNLLNKIGQGLLRKTATCNPDIVWVFKGLRIRPEILKQLKSKGILLANYNPDHPFQFSSKGSGNENITKSIGLYNLHFCYSAEVARRIEKEFGIKTASLPFGYEISEEILNSQNGGEEINRACFIGNPDKKRAAQIKLLADNNIPIDVFGHGWDEFLKPSQYLKIKDAVYGDEYWEKLRAYRVQLNLFRPHNVGSHNMRTFEVPAVGGVMLAPDSEEHRAFFEIGKEIFIFENDEELVAQVKMILKLPVSKILEIRQKARSRSFTDNYSYKGRAASVVDEFEKLVKAKGKASPVLN